MWSSYYNIFQVTALFLACYNKHEAIAVLLAKAGADPNITAKREDDSGVAETPLFQAAYEGMESVCQLLLDRGAGLHLGRSPLHAAALGGREDVCKLLLVRGADINMLESGESPLYIAARWDWSNVCKLLLDQGARLDHGKSPLHAVAQMGRETVCQLLLDRGININVLEYGESPLYAAAKSNEVAVVKLLLDKGAKLDAGKSSPLHAAVCILYGEAICKMLLNSGADINTLESGETALYLAAKEGTRSTGVRTAESICRLLLDKGARLDVGKDPLDIEDLNPIIRNMLMLA